jgi:acetyltransferase-like isoleucine patch superfamily enzyme
VAKKQIKEMNTNQIDPTAKIHPSVILGKFNKIGKNVVIEILGNNPKAKAVIGDNNIINDNTRIFIHGEFIVGDWNVFHNDMLIMPEDIMKIGHNCWFGQNTILDGTGGLEIGNGVRIGMYSQIWTHVASGEQMEGCTLFAKRKTIIHDDVWLVGSCVVSSGIELGRRSTALINSVITKNTLADSAYAGSPAKIMENVKFYLPKTLDEKFDMLKVWIEEFVVINAKEFKVESDENELILSNLKENQTVIFTKGNDKLSDLSQSIFYLSDKTFNKTNSVTERMIYKFLYGNKARFLPLKF